MTRGSRLRTALRIGSLILVVAWLFSSELRVAIPAIVPALLLIATEVEYVVGARRDRGAPSARGTAPGEEDADLGWGELVEDELGVRFRPPPQRLPRRRRDKLTTIGIIAALVAVIVVGARDDRAASWESLPTSDRSSVQARLQREAGAIAGLPVTLECTDYGFSGVRNDALGVAFPQRRLTYLRPSICRDLRDVLADGRAHGDRSAEAILVLAHEAVHLQGERREGVADCLGLQHGVRLGRRLGLDDEVAARLMRSSYLSALADRSLTRLEYRLPSDCRNGTELDLDPAAGRFP